MRIALVTGSYSPYIGGVEEHVSHVAQGLQRRGHDVAVWTVARDGRARSRIVDGIQVRDLPSSLPARSLSAIVRFPAAFLRAQSAWLGAYAGLRPQVLHVHCYGPNGTYALMLSKLTRTPLIVTAHGETMADDTEVFERSRLAARSLRLALARASAVTGCSRSTIDDLVDRFGLAPGRGSIVFNGIDTKEPDARRPSDLPPRYIAAIGRLQRLKGFDLLIEAFATAGVPEDVALVIGGGGPESSALHALARERGVADRVVFTGWLDRSTVRSVRRGALIGVVPSRYEPFGIAVLEIWRAGSTLVATSRGGPPEFVDDGVDGVLVDPLDIPAVGRVLRELCEDRDRASSLAIAGAERVKSFSWDKVVDAYERLYTDSTFR